MELLAPAFAAKVRANRQLVVFGARLLGLFLLWKIAFYFIWRSPEALSYYREFALGLIEALVSATASLLEQAYAIRFDSVARLVAIGHSGGVTVGEPCAGIEVMATFSALVLAWPAAFARKWWFLGAGLLGIQLLNVARIAGLALLSYYAPEWLDFNHKVGFQLVVFAAIFWAWIKWIKPAK